MIAEIEVDVVVAADAAIVTRTLLVPAETLNSGRMLQLCPEYAAALAAANKATIEKWCTAKELPCAPAQTLKGAIRTCRLDVSECARSSVG